MEFQTLIVKDSQGNKTTFSHLEPTLVLFQTLIVKDSQGNVQEMWMDGTSSTKSFQTLIVKDSQGNSTTVNSGE